MAYIKLYFDDDDSVMSSAGVFANDLEFTVNAPDNEVSDPVMLYAMADDGYVCTDVVVTPTGTTAAKWALAPDDGGSPGEWGAYGTALNLGTVNDHDHVPFHVRCKATGDEDPADDTSVTLVVSAAAAAE